ncbi:hypothetical protein SEA_ZENTENO07_72 [Mycobacterium phage Zenteno07]|nr:hypothetical protein SEA_ZENTENO07_72 [Mycobacterium phage Zenteno07]
MPTKKALKPTTSMTLAEIAEQVAEHTDVEALDAMVVRLHDIRAIVARLDTRRKDIYAEVKTRFHRGTSVVYDTSIPSGGYYLRETTTQVTRYRAVESAVVKKARPELWEAARTRKPWVQVKAPDGYEVPDLGALRLPPAGAMLRTLDANTLMRHYKAPVFEQISALKGEEKHITGVLSLLGAQGHLDDEQRFADGWAVTLARLEFDSEKLRRLDPEAWERMAVEKSKGGVTRLDVVALDRAQDFGMIDLDAEQFAQ